VSAAPDLGAVKAEILQIISADKWKSHQILFRHRHQYSGVPTVPPEFHEALVSDFWSSDPY